MLVLCSFAFAAINFFHDIFHVQGLCTLWCIPPSCAVKTDVSICQFSIAVQFNLGIISPPYFVGTFWGSCHLLYLFLVGNISSLGGGGSGTDPVVLGWICSALGEGCAGPLLWHCSCPCCCIGLDGPSYHHGHGLLYAMPGWYCQKFGSYHLRL